MIKQPNYNDIIIEGFETPSRKNRDSRRGEIITYHKSCVNLTRRLDLEHEHVESMWYELKTKLHNCMSINSFFNTVPVSRYSRNFNSQIYTEIGDQSS
jgi:hypothetical protein